MQSIIYAIRMVDNYRQEWNVLDMPSYIYTLSDEDGVRYVGQTNDPSIRLSGHMCNARNERDKTARGQWIFDLLKKHQEPLMTIIEKCGRDISNERERYWV